MRKGLERRGWGQIEPLSFLRLSPSGPILRLAAFADEYPEVVRGCTEPDQFPLGEFEVSLQFLIVGLLFDQKYQIFEDLSRPHYSFVKLPAATVIRPLVIILHSARLLVAVMQVLEQGLTAAATVLRYPVIIQSGRIIFRPLKAAEAVIHFRTCH